MVEGHDILNLICRIIFAPFWHGPFDEPLFPILQSPGSFLCTTVEVITAASLPLGRCQPHSEQKCVVRLELDSVGNVATSHFDVRRLCSLIPSFGPSLCVTCNSTFPSDPICLTLQLLTTRWNLDDKGACDGSSHTS